VKPLTTSYEAAGPELHHQRRGRERVGREQQRVAVRRRAAHIGVADRAARAGPVVHDDGLAQARLQLLGEQPRHGVGVAAGRVRDDDGDGLGRVGWRLSLGVHRTGPESSRKNTQSKEQRTADFHLGAFIGSARRDDRGGTAQHPGQHLDCIDVSYMEHRTVFETLTHRKMKLLINQPSETSN
jgi:hypothetical protein